MKKINILITFLLLFTALTFAQQKKYVSYEVKKRESLKSIAKNYNLSTKALSKLNPGVSRKPVMGTIIIVPNKSYGKPAGATVINEGVKTGESNDLYVVKPKETLYGISKKFNTSTEELIAANPQLTDGLKIGMQLTIPKSINLEGDEANQYVLHTVVKDNTLYNLSKKYEVSEAELMALNPALTDGLKLGMVLKIKPIKTDEEDLDGVQDSFLTVADFEENIHVNKEINLAVILPYKLNSLTDSLMDQNFAKNNLLNIVTDFHFGTKMAIDSLKSKGLNVNVKYYDSEASKQKAQILMSQNNNFNDVDLIIGPLFFDNAHWISKRTKTPVITPIYSKKQEEINQKNLIKSSPNSSELQQKMLMYLERNYNGENIVIINDGLGKTQSQLWQIVNKMKTFDSIQTISVIKPEEGYINREIFSEKLDTLGGKNWVLIVSDNNVMTTAGINGLKGFSKEVKIDLFALNKGKNFDNIENVLLGKLNFTYPTSEIINTDDVGVNYFYNAFKSKNGAFPSKYALRGFDVTYDTLVRYATDENLEEGLTDGKSIRTASLFNYKKNAFDAIENYGLILIRYNKDLSVTVLE